MPDDRIKRPAYQWYVNDARGDEVFMLMTYEQQGIYRALLDHQWVEGSIPANPDHLAALFPKISKGRFQGAWSLISAKFQPCGEGRLINAVLKAQEQELNAFIIEQQEKGAKGGRRKAENLAAARQRLALGRPQVVAESKPNPTSSSSSSPSTVEHKPSAAERTPTPAKEFLTWFQAEYKTRRNGATYFVSWNKHMPIVGRLLKLHDTQRLKKHAQVLLTTDEPWTETTDRGIEILAGKINWLEERLCAWEAKKRSREAV